MKIQIELPIPPSVNKCYATDFKTKRRFKSKDYENWMREADAKLFTQKQYKISGDEWLSVSYTVFTNLMCKNGNKRVFDLANFEKPLSDYLSSRIPGFQDHRILDLNMRKIDCSVERCIITITETVA